jgi:hypothetical protein
VEKWTWSCSGDNSFGQLAGPGDKTQAGAGLPGRIALGTWHGCAIQDPDITLCWGRGDGGQLGFAASDRCPIDGRAIPCSRKNAKVPFKLPPESQLFAGDMFTCALSKQGLLCWGASRDGWFGSAGACPARLRKEWPTLAGPTVPAPRATCARQPVLVPGFERVDIHPQYLGNLGTLSVGPRGACAVVNGRVRCVGAISTPAAELRNAWVSPGARANACGVLAEGQVLCWGEGYSPAKDPQAPVLVKLVPDLSPDVAVVDFAPASGTAWPPGYRIHRECDSAMVALPRCPVDTTGEPWSSLISQAPNLIGKIVSVRDRLIVGSPDNFGLSGGCTSRNGNPHGDEDLEARWTYANERPPYASLGCYPEQRFLVLGEGAEPLSLPDYACIGDESRLCCEAPAYGQTVVVTGELGRQPGWILTTPTICEVSGEK